jgi:nucleotide-binding universal stress UspA family protein
VGLTEILVHIDHHGSSAARVEVAIRLAKQHQARLTGLLIVRHGYPAVGDVEAAQQLFNQQTAKAGVEGRWVCQDGTKLEASMADLLLYHASFQDLVIVGQGSPESAWVGVPFDFPEKIILEAGRPVLVVPYAGTFAHVGERVLVAWKQGRASTRAIADALPILKQAQQVAFLTKIQSKDFLGLGDSLLAELCAHVARHGVTARAGCVLAEDLPFGDVLLNRAFDESYDLLVVGAYAHGPEEKRVLGSVASHLLREMTVPVLLSH